ncbi:MurR/RpiR family transcriptional regulator [Sphingosinicella rhizophila]|uniref:MurR/RpiR family transcriptional regulator n=1 Tax=Sphingosinicella rhizophila TaxID=3050082 RepID=A0ABU3Q8I9_9SPHN|nr:MurR/RpiR family transcriptional regulator [Sphingosinicella sp. GR2756]MDT9599723.1 MurR/RpiR family transcriptional regulator [Sphingosinicella sp. GR2756]
MTDGKHMSRDLLERLEGSLDSFTPAERTIANFILTNRGGIAFETANSIADKLQVSAITVGRFARKMGYRHFKDLKAGLRTTMSGVPWLVGDQLTEFVGARGTGNRTKRSLELELAGIIEVYALAESASWKAVVSLLAGSRHVHIAGFQTERGIAATLAHLLQYARDGVSIVDSSAGNYHEVFAAEPEGRCLVLIDMRRYSEQAYALAERASREGVKVVMITDKFCDWIRRFTPHVIAVSTEVELFWSSQVAVGCAVNLLVNDVIGALGPGVEKRLQRLSELYQSHTGHVGMRPGRKRSRP